jgi:translation initiation factor IF-2
VIVIAADDGVKPQTVEAVKFAQSANAKIIVAINKIDKEGADVHRVMAEMATEFSLNPEEWGGDTIFVPISAKTGENLDKLVDMILLTADIEELKADTDGPAEGLVIESHTEVGKGAVVNLLVTSGELRLREFVVAGGAYAKIKTMTDWKGRAKGKALPSTPVVVTGFKDLPKFGDMFIESEDEKTARRAALLNGMSEKNEAASSNVTSSDLLRMMKNTDTQKVFNLIIKGDTLGSVTSVVDSLKMIDTKDEINLNIAATGVGDITENDVYMAVGENTAIYGFNVSIPAGVRRTAERDGVKVSAFKVIYELLDDAKNEMEKLLDDEVIEEVVGGLEVKGVFRTEREEIIAGGTMTSGVARAGVLARFLRKDEEIGEGEVGGVQREKLDATELVEGVTGGLKLKTEK